jgi:hypothetical protein
MIRFHKTDPLKGNLVMKKTIVIAVLVILGLSFLITGCSGGISVNAWPSAAPGKDVVYLASGNFIYRKPIKSDTEQYWVYPKTADSSKVFFSAPAISDDGNLIVAGSWYSTTGNKYGLYGITKSGTDAWASPFLGATGRWIASPVICGDRIYAANMDQNIYVLDLEGNLLSTYGKVEYARDTDQDVNKVNMGSFWAQPVCDDSSVYISNLNHYLLAFKQGDVLKFEWRADLKAALVASPVILSDGDLLLGNINGDLIIVKKETGGIVHQAELQGGIWSRATLTDDSIYVGTQSDLVYKLNQELVIDQASPYQLDGAITGSGVLVNNDGNVLPERVGVYFGTDAGTIWKIGFNNEMEQIQNGYGGKFYSDPLVINDTLVLPITGGGTNLMFLLNLVTNEPSPFAPAQ